MSLMQYEAAWRAGNWDFSLISPDSKTHSAESARYMSGQFNENLHRCLPYNSKLLKQTSGPSKCECTSTLSSIDNQYLCLF